MFRDNSEEKIPIASSNKDVINDPVITAYRQSWNMKLIELLDSLTRPEEQNDALEKLFIRDGENELKWQIAKQKIELTSRVKSILESKEDDLNHNFVLGIIYYFGLGCEIDFKKALKFFEKSGNKGNSNAWVMLYNLYRTLSVEHPQDKEQLLQLANKFFKKAFESRNSFAIGEDAVQKYTQARGQNNEVEIAKSISMLKDIAEVSRRALLHLARAYFFRNDTQGISYVTKLLESSASFGYPFALYILGRIFEKQNKLDKALQYFSEAADKGMSVALEKLGDFYDSSGHPGKAAKAYRDASIIREVMDGVTDFRLLNMLMAKHIDGLTSEINYHVSLANFNVEKLRDVYKTDPAFISQLWTDDINSPISSISERAYEIMSKVFEEIDHAAAQQNDNKSLIIYNATNHRIRVLLALHQAPKLSDNNPERFLQLFQQLNEIKPEHLNPVECFEMGFWLYHCYTLTDDQHHFHRAEIFLKRAASYDPDALRVTLSELISTVATLTKTNSAVTNNISFLLLDIRTEINKIESALSHDKVKDFNSAKNDAKDFLKSISNVESLSDAQDEKPNRDSGLTTKSNNSPFLDSLNKNLKNKNLSTTINNNATSLDPTESEEEMKNKPKSK